MHFELAILTGAKAGEAFRVPAGATLYVGKHRTVSAAILDDDRMAVVHFALDFDGQTCRLKDLGSPSGTLVNGLRVTQAVVRTGDRIVAGQTSFVIRHADSPSQGPSVSATGQRDGGPPRAPVWEGDLRPSHPARPPSMPAHGPQDLPRRVLDVLCREPRPLFALLDAARDPEVLKFLRASGLEHQSLYEGAKGDALSAWGPFLVRLDPTSASVEHLLRKGWGNSWGVFVGCGNSLGEVRRHLRHFLQVRLPDGRQVYFRFYDPRVLKAFLPSCDAQQAAAFFGPVDRFLMEDDEPDTLLRFTLGKGGVARHPVAVGGRPADPGFRQS